MSVDAGMVASDAREPLIEDTANMPKELRTQVLRYLALLRRPMHLYKGNLVPAQDQDIESVDYFTTRLEANYYLKKEYEDIFYPGNVFIVALRSEADIEHTASGPQLRVTNLQGYHLGNIYHLRLVVNLVLNSYNHISREEYYKAVARFAATCTSLRSATIHFRYSPGTQDKTIGRELALYAGMKEVLKAMWLHVPEKIEQISCRLTDDDSDLASMEGRALQDGESSNTQEEITDPEELAWMLAVDWRLEIAQGAKMVRGKLSREGVKQMTEFRTEDG